MDFSLTYHSHTPRVGGGYQGGFFWLFLAFFFLFLSTGLVSFVTSAPI